MKTTKLLAATLLAVTATNTKADFFVNAFGINSPGTIITFDEVVLPASTALTTQYSSYGVTFGNLFYNSQGPFNLGNLQSPAAHNYDFISPESLNPFSVYFNNDQTAAAFTFVTNPGEITLFEAYLDGVLQDSGSAPTDVTGLNYYGFENELFDEIRISVSYNVNGAGVLDNIQFDGGEAPVPEVGTMAGAALFALGAIAVRARRKQA